MIATIVRIEGNVQVQRADGSIETLAVGDQLFDGDVVLTPEDGQVVLEYENNEQVLLTEGVELAITREQLSDESVDDAEFVANEDSVDDIISMLDDTDGDLLEQFEATAAGNVGSGGNSGSNFVRLSRALENVYDTPVGLTPVDITRPQNAESDITQPDSSGVFGGTISVNADYAQGGSGLTVAGTVTNLPAGTTVSLLLTDSQGNQFTVLTTTDANGSYSVAGVDLASLTDGNVTVEASVVDATGATLTDSTSVEIDEVQGNLTVDVTTDGGVLTASGTSVDLAEGTEVTVTITDANGNTITATAIVDADGNYTVDADVSGLTDGEVSIDVTATDNNGEEVSVTDSTVLDNVAGDLTVDSSVTEGSITVSGTSVDMPEGTQVNVVITDANGDTVTTTATIDANGNYTVDADVSGLIDGQLDITATASDNNDTVQSATDTAELDNVAGDLTVDSSVTDGSITIAGTSTDMPEGTEVSITIADANGDTVTTTATIGADGNYTVDADISGLVDGQLDITATASDNNGTEQNATDTTELDNVAGDLTVDSSVVDGNITVSGTSVDMPEGTEVSITITDQNDNVVTTTATIDANGNYTVHEDISGLVDGQLNIDVSATDNNGTEQTATDTAILDNVAGDLTVDSSVTDGSITVSGTSVDMPEGTEVSITITDDNGNKVTTTATIGADGTYTVSEDISGLVDGELTIDVSATDNNGTEQTASAIDELDNVAGDLTVDSSVVDGSITVSGTSVDMPEGTEVSITITDANGDTVTTVATIDANGNYTVDADVSGLVDGQLDITATASDNNGTEQTATDTAVLDSVAGDLTVDTSVTDGTVTVSGTSADMPEGTEVSITITDQNDNVVTTTATIAADGSYTVSTDVSGLVDGQLDITAIASDNNGTEQTATDTAILDNVAGDLTVDSSVTDGSITVSGTSVDMPEGTEVTVTITDQNDNVVTTTATIDANGNYTVDADISGLTDGALTVDALALDNNGTEQTASANNELDNIAGDLTVDSSVVDGNITVSGTSTDMPEGTEVSITITDDNGNKVTTTATIGADGTYTVSEDISGLVDGELTIDISATDNNGTEQTASAIDELDNVAGDLTVDSTVIDDSITVSGTSSDMPEGTEITVTITDQNDNVVTTTATIDANGNYTIDADISGLTDGALTINVSALDNNGTEQIASANDVLDNVAGDLTVDSSVTDGSITVSGTSTDMPEGTEVTITITDQNNESVTTTATIDSDGNYSVDTDVSGLVDGQLNIDVSATDNNGTEQTATDTATLDNVAGDLTVDSSVTDGNITVSGTSTDMPEGTEVTITIADTNGDTVTTTATIGADGSYTVDAEVSGLVDGQLDITATGSDNNGTEQTATDTTELDNVAGDLTVDSSVTDGTVTVSGTSVDMPEGTEVSVTITDDNGDTVTTTATIGADGSYIVNADVSGLVDGQLDITATGSDNNGTEQTATDTTELDNVAGDLTVDSSVTDGTVTVSGTSADMPAGTEVSITITDQNDNVVTTTATIDADGNYTVNEDISGLVDGQLTINAAAEDNNGTEQTATDTTELDNVAGDLTVDSTVTDGNITVSGTSTDMPEGTEVSITITDQNDNVVTTTATIDANGNYTIDADISGLTDGALTVDVSALDNNGTEQTATDTTVLDNVAGDLTVDSSVTDGSITVSGTSADMPEGTEVSITITDQNDNVVTTTATIAADGSYTVSTDVSGLVDGQLDITATASDNNGTDQTATDTTVLDNVAGDLTVDSSVTDGSITVSGTSADMPEGTEVSITITDQNDNVVTTTATVDANGNYTVDADISGLTDGALTIDVSAQDNNGTEQTATANDVLDNVAGDLTVDSSVTDGSITVSGTSADMPEGTEVTITITDNNGDSVTTTALIGADGTYTVDADISGLVDGQLTINAAAEDNNGTEQTATDTAELDNVAGDLTVDSSVTDGSITVSGTSVDMPEGTEVSITITDQNDNVVTTTATIDGNGNYTVNEDISGLVDGDVTIDVSATDNNGTEQTATDTTVLDNVAGDLTVDSSVTDGSITVSGTSADMPEGTQVNVVITDANGDTVTTTATIGADGTYTVSEDISGLVDGELTIDVSATDNNGTEQTATETTTLDNVAGDLTVDTSVIDGAVTVSGTSTDMPEGTEVSVTITDQNDNVITTTATIAADGSYTVDADISGLTDGALTIDVSAQDNNGTEQTATANDVLDNVAGDLTVDSSVTDGTVTVSGTSTDMPEGTEVSVTITDQNDNVITTTATIAADGSYTVDADISGLIDGNLTINAIAEDNNGTEQTASTNNELDNVAGDLTVDSTVTDGSITVSGTSVDMPEGTEVSITITDQNDNVVTTTATIDANGNYTVNEDISGLVDGDVTIDVSALDNNGTEQNATDTAVLDNVAGNLTVDSSVTDGSITVSGTSVDMPEGTEVSITITDQNDNVVTTTATIDANGNYTVDADISGLTDGALTVDVSATDNNGTEQTATDTAELDNVAGDLTVDSSVTDGSITVSGTSTDMPEGTEVSITITDQNDNVVTTTATIDANGNYTIDADISGLTDGALTVDASALDNNGTEQTANTADELDNVAGDLTVDTPVTDGTVTVSGTSTDMPEGTEVSITITDQNDNVITTTATIGADGTYSINEDISGLVDGELIIDVSATDNNGTEQTATETTTLDNVAGDLTVDTSVIDGAVTVSGTSTDMPEGTEVSITITDDNGNTVTTVATIDANGNYTVDADISGLTDGALTVDASALDNNGTEQTASANDELDNVAGDLTVNSSVTDGSITVSGTSADMPEGTQVNVVITDANGDTVTTVATIDANGNYTIDADISALTDGNLTINVVAEDNNGAEQTANTTDELDNVAGDLTVDTSVTDGTVTVSGTSADMPEGTEVSITITDQNDNVVTTTATIGADGNYTVNEDVSGLVDGDVTIDVSALDNNGTEQNATDTTILDNLAGDLTVDSTVTDGNIVVSGTSADMPEGTEVSITITDQNDNVVTTTATIDANGNYTIDADISGLTDGALTVDVSALDNNGTEQTATDTTVLDNVAGDLTVDSTVTDGSITVSGTSVDMPEGTEVSITITDDNGDAVTTTATIGADGTYTVSEDISGLVDGELTIDVSATDNNGTEQTATETTTLDNVAGDLTVDTSVIDGAVTVSGTSTDMPEGTEVSITITDDNGNTVTTVATIDANGNYTVDADVSGLVDGQLDITATASDNNGTEQNATDTTELDNVAGDLTVDSSVTDGSITVSGSSVDMPEGTEVSITITDQNDNVVTTTATIGADGSYTVNEDISGLVDGALTIDVSATDNNGTEQTAADTAILDNVAGDLTVDSSVTDGSITVSGTSVDMPEGTEVSITITNDNGDTVTTTATIGADGTYTVSEDISGLVDGELTINASASDNNETEQTATDTAVLDNVAGDLTVDSSVTDGSITVSGTSADMPEGTEVTITITDNNGDSVTTTALIGADGTYTVDADISSLVDGQLTINAAAEDNNGTEQTANTTDELDNVAGDLTVDSSVTDGSITVAGTSTDMPEGTEVSITITDQNDNVVTTTATIDANGNYTVNEDISGLVDGDVTIDVSATDNNGTEQTATDTTVLDTVAGDLTVDSSVTDGSITVSGTSADMPEDTEVTITIADTNGDTVTTTATIGADGNYTVNADVSGLVDGQLDITAIASDNNGTEQNATDTTELDNVAGDLTVDSSVTDGTVTVSGTSVDMPEGTEVSITIADANGDTVTTVATIDANGNYTVDADVSGLVDGELDITATASDNNGTEQNATDTAVLDNVAGDLTVDSTVTDGSITVSGTSVDMPEGTEVSITITDDNGDKVSTTATIGADGTYTVSEDISGLVDGDVTIDVSATDNNGTEQTATDTAVLDNVAGDLTVDSSVVDGNITVSGTSVDMPAGTEVSITIADANGDTVTTVATIDASGNYTVNEDISGLVDGQLNIDVSATDNNGTEQTATDTAILDNVAGDLTVDSSVTDGTVTVSGTSVDMPEGTEVSITITDQNDNVVTTTATINANGNYTVNEDISGLVDGQLDITATASDNNGTEQSATDTAVLDNVAGDLTVDSSVTDGSITVSGTSADMPEGTQVNVVITDGNGNTVTTVATIDANGNYTVDADVSGLVDGELNITATASDNNDTVQSATDTAVLDNVAGDLTVDSSVTDGSITIAGTSTDMPEGTEVSITIADANGDTVTTTATIGADGNYTVDADVSGLVDGQLDITATASDNNGTEQTANDTAELDNVAGDLTVDSSVTDGSITVSGTSADMPEGTEVSITITDQNDNVVTTTATIDGNGNYTVNEDISGLVDGDVTIDVSATDNNGTEQTATDTTVLDNVAGDLTVDSSVTDGSITVSGTSADMPEGTQVNVVITDANGDTVTTTATIGADGTYTVSEDISGLVDGELTIDVSATDNNGTEQTATANDELDNVAGDLTVDSSVVDGNITVSGTSVDMPEGTEVSITITDQNDNVVTTTATIDANGNYTVDTDISGLTDGELTVNAVAEDNNGTEQTANTTDELDNVAGDLTVDSSVTDGSIIVSGTSVDIPEGTEVSITIADANGDTVTTTATIGADGNYTVDADVSGLVDGDLTIDVSALDNNGTEQTATANDELDNVAGDLTVDSSVTDGSITVSGTSVDMPEGTEVSITITDANGDTVTTVATIDANGNYTVDADASGLVDGQLEITVTASDNNGTDQTATDTAVLDNVAGDLTVDSSVTDGSITVSGTSVDMPEGTQVTITITDQNDETVTTTATIDADGNYSVDTDVSGLVDGQLNIDVSATDNNGTEQTATDTATLDNVAGDLTVDTSVTDGSITVSGTSADMPEGTEVSITITDQNDNVVTTTATIGADGSYTVDADASGLVDGQLDITATASDNNGIEQNATDTTELDNVAGDLTVDTSVTDGTVTVSGTSADMPEGTEVSITITDANGDIVTTTATIGADGNYTVNEDISGLVDGDVTIDVSALDNNGTEQNATDTAVLDNVAGDLTVDSSVTDGSITVSGTSADMPEGTEVSITITDQNDNVVTTTATIDANGNYTIDADISGLTDGALTVDVSALDNNGTEQTATDTTVLDNVAGDLTVDSSVTDGSITVSGTSADMPEGTEVSITITDQNDNVVTTTATIAADGSYTVSTDVSGLVDGQLDITATASDNNDTVQSATDTAELDNVAGNLTVDSSVTDGSITVSGTSLDMPEGTEVSITIADANGDTVTTTAAIGADGTYTVSEDISGLVDGDVTIDVSATDNNGTEQTATETKTLDNVAGDLTVDSSVTDGSITVSGTSVDMPEGTEVSVTITDQNDNVVTTTATIDANGNYTVNEDISDLVDGDVTIDVSATDNNGTEQTATDTTVLDNVAGDLTVDSSVTDGSITVSGTSADMPEGTQVNVVITDANGDTVTTTATIGADGTYTVSEYISGLVDGELTIDVSATDNNGTEQTATANDELDNVAGDLTVDSSVVDGNITVSGTSVDMPEGTEVSITITDDNGDIVTTTATIGADGNYTVDADVSGLVDGDLTIDVSALDNNGTEQTATANDEFDNVAGDLTVDSSVTDGSITVSGTSVDMPEGTEVSITITDANGDIVTTTATIGADGNYTVNEDISDLVDGDVTIDVSALDNNGTEQNATDTAVLDNLAGDLTVDSTVTDGSITVSGTSADMPAGTEVSITITDDNGDTVTTVATIDANGNYTVDADVSGLVDGTLAVDVSAEDNNGTEQTATDTVVLDNVAGDLTVDSSVTDGSITVSGTSADMPEGTEVSITITDANGDTVTTVATIDANGNYTVDADASGLVDGQLEITVTASDNNGTDQTATDTAVLDNVAGDLTVDSSVTDGSITVSGTSVDMPEGTEVSVTITDQNDNVVTTTATIDANGNYTVDADISGLTDGELTINAAAEDNNGTEQTATDTAELDNVAGDLTVDSSVTDGTVTVSGTSTDIPEGTEVSITIADANGDTVTTVATIDANGNYTVDADVSGLVDGQLDITATASDNNDTDQTAADTAVLDNVAGDLTVDSSVTDGSITVSGTSTDMPEGTEVSITITDQNDNVVTTTATIDANGNYTIDADISALTDGSLTINAIAEDNNGTEQTATDTAELDNVAGDLTVDSSVTDGSITVSGTSADMPEGTEVSITITDQNDNVVTTTATIDASGNYTVDADISSLVDGDVTIDVSATDNNGAEQTATDTAVLDNVAGDLTVDSSVTDGSITVSGTSADMPEGAEVSVTITDANGDTVTTVATIDANGDYTVDADVSGLIDGQLDITTTADDNNGTEQTATDTAVLDNVAGDLTVDSSVTDGSITVSGTSTDMPEGTEVSITITDQNDNVITTTATIAADGSYTVDADISDLTDGALTIDVSALDNNGTEQTATDTAVLDNVAGDLTVDSSVTDGNITVSGTSADMPEGTEVSITITDQNDNVVTTTATIDANGNYTIDADISALTDGGLTIDVSATDNNGTEQSATANDVLDNVAGDLTVDSSVTDGNITVSGTSTDMSEGTEVSITITDQNDNVVTTTATIGADGTYTVNADVSGLIDGDLIIDVSALDNNGTEQTATDTTVLDNVAGDLTVDSSVTDGSITVSGTSVDMPEGTEVSITITDQNDNVVTTTATIDGNGNYTVNEDISGLVDGDVTIDVSATDNNGTEQTATDTTVLDNVAGDLTVDSSVTDGSITVSGTSADMPKGTQVNVVITDANGDTVTTTATIGADGTYTVSEDISGLVDGELTIDVSAFDNNGTEQTATDTTELDNVAGDLTVDSSVTDGSITVSGASADMPEGTEVTITITDQNDNVVTTTATIGADGSYTVDADISGLVDGQLNINAAAEDNNGTEQTATDTVGLDTTAPTLTIDASDTNDTIPAISGTSDEIGATVHITVTDANNQVQTLTAIVATDGSWTVQVPDELVEGTYTVQASVEDNAGNEAVANAQAEVDLTAPTLTLEVQTNVSDTTPTISGTSDEFGGTVHITVVDANGREQQLEATVDSNGNWQVDVEIPLAEGEYTANASISDEVGNQTQASQSQGFIEPSVVIVDFELNSEVGVDITDSIWDGGVSNNQFGIVWGAVDESNANQQVRGRSILDDSTANLKIVSQEGSNETYLLAVGDTYNVSFQLLTHSGWTTVEMEMKVTRSDVQAVNGDATEILVLTGSYFGTDITMVMHSDGIQQGGWFSSVNYYVNDQFDTDVGFREFTVNGEAAANSTVTIEQVDENGNVMDSTTVTTDNNGTWSYDVGQLSGRSGLLKVTSVDQYGNESVDAKNFLFGETNSANTLEGTNDSDLIVGGLEDDTITGGGDSDVLIGGGGHDTFVWNASDEGTVNIPETDTIQDFTLGNFATNEDADRLDLSELLQGESVSSIDSYLYAEDDGNGNTVLYINSEGDLSGSDSANQLVTLQDVQMAEGQSSSDFIQQMLNDGQLLIDSGSSASTHGGNEGAYIGLNQVDKTIDS